MAIKRVLNTSTGKRNPNERKRVVRMRDRDEMSWAAIAEALEIAPRTARRIYDEAKGDGAHFESRPLVGGRPAPVREEASASE
jgi:hypothetical protein